MSQLYGYNTIVSDSQDVWKIKNMHKHISPLFPHPPGSSHQNTLPHQMFTIETQSEILSRWRALEGAGDQRIERTSSLVRKCADGVAVSIRYDVTVVPIVLNFPRFLGN